MADNKVVVATKEDIEKNKVFAILAYLGILCLVPLLAAKDSPYARFHANQGLVLFLVEVVVTVLMNLATIAFFFNPLLGLLNLLLWLVWVGVLVLSVMGIVGAAQGQMKKLPLVGDFTLVK